VKKIGLTVKEVEESRKNFGDNSLTQIPPEPLWKKLLEDNLVRYIHRSL